VSGSRKLRCAVAQKEENLNDMKMQTKVEKAEIDNLLST